MIFFKQQGRKYSFNEVKYLQAFENVPVATEQEVNKSWPFC
jgi:hypothetical protein